jgi:hypothetical protein
MGNFGTRSVCVLEQLRPSLHVCTLSHTAVFRLMVKLMDIPLMGPEPNIVML